MLCLAAILKRFYRRVRANAVARKVGFRPRRCTFYLYRQSLSRALPAATILPSVDESEGLVLTLTTLQLGGAWRSWTCVPVTPGRLSAQSCEIVFGGAVAQLGARLDGIEEVVGSNPIGSTI